MLRSHLYAPGMSERMLTRVFEAGADAVILDLEDAVPPEQKDRARGLVAETLAGHSAWVRVNAVGTVACARDLEVVGGLAAGLRVPKVETPAQVAWVAERAPGVPIVCIIESARGLAAVEGIARAPQVCGLALGATDLAVDLGADDGQLPLLYARSRLVMAARLAGIDPPIDSVHRGLDDTAGLRDAAEHARRLGFFGKSAVHPGQVAVINAVFTPRPDDVERARALLAAFAAGGGAALRLPDGEFVDLAVAERARRLVALAERVA
jgi:citrate lyase subunit beta/citryl-CoA lyase